VEPESVDLYIPRKPLPDPAPNAYTTFGLIGVTSIASLVGLNGGIPCPIIEEKLSPPSVDL